MIFVPFGIVLFCLPSVASRLGSRLSDIALDAVVPVRQVTQARAAFDPFAAELLPASAVVVDEATAADGSMESLSEFDAPAGASSVANGSSPTRKRSVKGPAGDRLKPLPSVRVTQAVVLRLAQTGTRPSGRPVATDRSRPAGIQVFGVSALGIGVRDGDVLTQVSDVPVTQVGQVIAMVIAARGARKPVMTGRLWRGNRSYTIIVEQPYPREFEEKPANRATLSDGELQTGRATADGY